MKMISLREAKQSLSGYVVEAQKNQILITKHGKPSALIRGVEGYDIEDIVTMTNKSFWSMIRQRRAQRAIPWTRKRRSH